MDCAVRMVRMVRMVMVEMAAFEMGTVDHCGLTAQTARSSHWPSGAVTHSGASPTASSLEGAPSLGDLAIFSQNVPDMTGFSVCTRSTSIIIIGQHRSTNNFKDMIEYVNNMSIICQHESQSVSVQTLQTVLRHVRMLI